MASSGQKSTVFSATKQAKNQIFNLYFQIYTNSINWFLATLQKCWNFRFRKISAICYIWCCATFFLVLMFEIGYNFLFLFNIDRIEIY